MITLIPAGNPGAFTGPSGNNTWLIDGAEPLLVDAGVGEPSHLAALEAALAGRPLARVFLTHAHPDHAGGVPRLREAWPGVEIVDWASARALKGRATAPQGRATTPQGRATTLQDRAAEGRVTIPAGDGVIEIIPTPGHSPDHLCLWDQETRVLFAGDLMVKGGTIMIAASSGGNLREYLGSLARVRALAPLRVYPGHGPIIDDAPALVDEYVAHRAARERQVIGLLERGPASADALVSAIYPDLDPALSGAARETVLAHLAKLREERRASEAGGLWHPAGRS